MKTQYIKIFFLTAVLGICSCEDYLEPEPISFVSDDNLLINDEGLEVGILNIYDGLQGESNQQITGFRSTQVEYMLTELRTDNARARGGGDLTSDFQQMELYEISDNNAVVLNYYTSMYNVIFRANLILDNLDAASSERRGAFEGEAKFIRAYTYFQLVRLFGAVPLPLSAAPDVDGSISFTRVSPSVVYDQIIDDLGVGIENLDNTFKTRASRAAAQALLAKVYLTLAAEGETDLYDNARILCDDVIGSGFELEPDYMNVFTSERNNEIIFAIDYIENNAETSQRFSWQMSEAGDRKLNYTTQNIRSFWDGRGETVRNVSGEESTQQSGQFPNLKYGSSDLAEPIFSGTDWVVLRLADVLLMYVEAVLEGGDVTTDASAIDQFERVRNRAGFFTPVVSITKEELLEERRAELSFENHRFFDLLRFDPNGTILRAHSDATSGFFQITDLLLPLPQAEIELSENRLAQNPGY